VREKRIYYRRLVTILGTIAGIMLLMLGLSLFLTIRIVSQKADHLLSDTVSVQRELFNGTMNYVKDTIGRISSDENLIRWLRSENESPDYYYYALRTYETISQESTFQNYLDYSIDIAREDENSFLITKGGTTSQDLYYSNSCINRTEKGTPISGIYPSYDSNDSIESIKLVVNRRIDDSYVYFITSFMISQELDSSYIVFHDTGQNITFSDNSDLRYTLKNFDWKAGKSEVEGYTIVVDEYYELGFSAAFIYRTPSSIAAHMILATVLAIMAIVLVILFQTMTRVLYAPIERTLKEMDAENSIKDEFALIRSQGKKIALLSQELDDAISRQKTLSLNQKYGLLVRGIPSDISDIDSTSYFTVAVLEQKDRKTDMAFSKLLNTHDKSGDIHFVRTERDEAVIIFQSPDEKSRDLFIKKLRTTLFGEDEDIDISVAVSDTLQGSSRVHELYNRARDILKYRYRINDKAILTEQDVAGFLEGIDFPLAEENILITRLLAKSDEALEIYDSAINKNLAPERRTKPEDLLRFSYLMVSIVMRFYQELKCSPEDIIGYSISWDELYIQKDYYETFRNVRTILSDTLTELRMKEKEEGNQLIGKMKAFINEHYMENIMLIDLSNQFNLTPKYCSYIFAQFSGENFKNYLNRLRINKAKKMIEQDPEIKISILSLKTGFSSPNSFIRVFSQYTGVTPKTFASSIAKGKKR